MAENPPADVMVAAYLGYKPPSPGAAGSDSEEPEEWDCPFPDVTE